MLDDLWEYIKNLPSKKTIMRIPRFYMSKYFIHSFVATITLYLSVFNVYQIGGIYAAMAAAGYVAYFIKYGWGIFKKREDARIKKAENKALIIKTHYRYINTACDRLILAYRSKQINRFNYRLTRFKEIVTDIITQECSATLLDHSNLNKDLNELSMHDAGFIDQLNRTMRNIKNILNASYMSFNPKE